MPIAGTVAPGYEPVAEAFAANFGERGEVGAAFAAYRDGVPVVDLWGGLADPATESPWERDTAPVIFSGTKGLVAVCMLVLVDRGVLDLDAPVCHYWPEFARAGKDAILVRDVVSHRSGLPGVRTTLTKRDILDERLMARLLEAESPFWDGEPRVCYHPLTFGWLCGELVRRADGRRVGRFFAEEIAGPLELDVWIGLPAVLEPRVATLVAGASWGTSHQALSPTDPRAVAVWDNPRHRLSPPLQQNTRAFHAAGIPASGGIGTSRSLAKLYACLAGDGAIGELRLMSPEALAHARQCLARDIDALLGTPKAFSAGFELQTDVKHFGPPETAFGHTGAGGSVQGAWPDHGVAFAYVMNELRDDRPDPRAEALLHALYDVVSPSTRRR